MHLNILACQTSVVASHHSNCSTCQVYELVTALEACVIVVLWLMWAADVRLQKWLHPKPPETNT